MKDTVTNDCVIRKNEELKSHYQKPNIVEEIRNKTTRDYNVKLGETKTHYSVQYRKKPIKKKTHWKTENYVGRMKDVIKKDVENLWGGSDCKARAAGFNGRNGWK